MSVGYKHRQQVRLGFLCSQELATAIDDRAKKEGLALTELIRLVMTEYLTQP